MKLESVKIQRKRGKCNHAIIIIWTLKRSGLLPLFFLFFKCCCCSLFVWLFIFKCFAQINEINNDEEKDYKTEIKKTHIQKEIEIERIKTLRIKCFSALHCIQLLNRREALLVFVLIIFHSQLLFFHIWIQCWFFFFSQCLNHRSYQSKIVMGQSLRFLVCSFAH